MTWLTWALLSAVFAALTALSAKAGIAGVNANLATAVRTSIVVVFAWSIAIAAGAHGEVTLLSRRNWLFLILSGLATGFSWICYFKALSMGQASRVGPVDKLSVIFVILLASPLLGESITSAKLIGGLLIVAGVVVTSFS